MSSTPVGKQVAWGRRHQVLPRVRSAATAAAWWSMSGHQRQTWLVRTQTAATLLLLGFPIHQSPALLSLEGARFGTQDKQELKTETKGWMDGSFGYVGVVVADWIEWAILLENWRRRGGLMESGSQQLLYIGGSVIRRERRTNSRVGVNKTGD
jgi:hypothetical protein